MPNSAMAAMMGVSDHGGYALPELESIMRSRSRLDRSAPEGGQRTEAASAPDTSQLSQGSGHSLQLPDQLKSGIESHFGYSVDGLDIRESADVNSLGAKAYARGNEIHFAPGQFRPHTAEGRKMIGHEVAHVLQQSKGGMGSGVNLDPAMEHQADIQGDFISAGSTYGGSDSAPLAPMPSLSFSSAPVQGWGIDFFHRKNKGEHEQLTEAARKKATKFLGQEDGEEEGMLSSKRAQKSLDYGSRFNDVGHHSLLGMILSMELTHSDEFINQTHHGDMQFLHSMDTSGGQTARNTAKMRRYAQFTSDTYQNRATDNGGNFQDQNMLDYVLSQNGEDDPFQEMMLSTMVSSSAMKKFNKSRPKKEDAASRLQAMKSLVTFSDADRDAARAAAEAKYDKKGRFGKWMAGDREKFIAKQIKKAEDKKLANRSSYAKGTVGNFFTGGSKGLDAGLVALGSAAHMIEDSFAGSHSLRSDNLYVNTTPDTELSESGQSIVDKATPIISNADYNKQDNNPLWGRHPKGDVFEDGDTLDEQFTNTRGASLARDSAAQFMVMNARMKSSWMPRKEGYTGSALDKFVQGITRHERYAIDASGQTTTTTTGRAYDTAYKGIKPTRDVKQSIDSYHKGTAALAPNRHTTPEERIIQYRQEVPRLLTILQSTNPRNEAAKAKYRPHAVELVVNITSMLRQLQGTPDLQNNERVQAQMQELSEQKQRLMDIIYD